MLHQLLRTVEEAGDAGFGLRFFFTCLHMVEHLRVVPVAFECLLQCVGKLRERPLLLLIFHAFLHQSQQDGALGDEDGLVCEVDQMLL